MTNLSENYLRMDLVYSFSRTIRRATKKSLNLSPRIHQKCGSLPLLSFRCMEASPRCIAFLRFFILRVTSCSEGILANFFLHFEKGMINIVGWTCLDRGYDLCII